MCVRRLPWSCGDRARRSTAKLRSWHRGRRAGARRSAANSDRSGVAMAACGEATGARWWRRRGAVPQVASTCRPRRWAPGRHRDCHNIRLRRDPPPRHCSRRGARGASGSGGRANGRGPRRIPARAETAAGIKDVLTAAHHGVLEGRGRVGGSRWWQRRAGTAASTGAAAGSGRCRRDGEVTDGRPAWPGGECGAGPRFGQERLAPIRRAGPERTERHWDGAPGA
jgi:hypothetical protein